MKKHKLFNKTVFNKSNTRTIPMHAAMTCVIALLLGISAGILSYSQVFRTPDEYVTNYIYTYNPFSRADDRITLISIDSDMVTIPIGTEAYYLKLWISYQIMMLQQLHLM